MTTNPATPVKYSAAASGAGNVQLPSDVGHSRQEYDIGVKVKGWETAGGLIVSRRIRVALDQYRGTALAATPAVSGRAITTPQYGRIKVHMGTRVVEWCSSNRGRWVGVGG